MRRRYVSHGDRIFETDPPGQRTGEKSDALFLDMNSFCPSAIVLREQHFSFVVFFFLAAQFQLITRKW